jgi:hypothetical protein
MKDDNKIVVTLNNSYITKLANRYKDLNTQLKDVKDNRDATLKDLRVKVLGYFDPEDETKTRILKTSSVRVTVNKRTIRKVLKTDMEAVFENICILHDIKREELDKIVENNSTMTEVEVTPAVKVS